MPDTPTFPTAEELKAAAKGMTDALENARLRLERLALFAGVADQLHEIVFEQGRAAVILKNDDGTLLVQAFGDD